MASKTITGVLIDNTTNKTKIAKYDLEQTTKPNLNLQRIYAMLNCDCIDCVTRKFGEHYYDIWCDDEGLFKEAPLPAIATFNEGEIVEQIVGNVFICKHDGKGGMQSLTQEEYEEVISKTLAYIDDNGNIRVVLGASL